MLLSLTQILLLLLRGTGYILPVNIKIFYKNTIFLKTHLVFDKNSYNWLSNKPLSTGKYKIEN